MSVVDAHIAHGHTRTHTKPALRSSRLFSHPPPVHLHLPHANIALFYSVVRPKRTTVCEPFGLLCCTLYTANEAVAAASSTSRLLAVAHRICVSCETCIVQYFIVCRHLYLTPLPINKRNCTYYVRYCCRCRRRLRQNIGNNVF